MRLFDRQGVAREGSPRPREDEIVESPVDRHFRMVVAEDRQANLLHREEIIGCHDDAEPAGPAVRRRRLRLLRHLRGGLLCWRLDRARRLRSLRRRDLSGRDLSRCRLDEAPQQQCDEQRANGQRMDSAGKRKTTTGVGEEPKLERARIWRKARGFTCRDFPSASIDSASSQSRSSVRPAPFRAQNPRARTSARPFRSRARSAGRFRPEVAIA
jgi:hypothetical protein